MKILVKILVVEDDLGLIKMFERIFKEIPNLKVLTATTIEKAEKVFHENPDLSIVALDGNLMQEGFYKKTVPLAKKIRSSFKGTMIAMSCDPQTQGDLMKVPCDYAVEKFNLAEFVKKLPSLA